MTDSSYHCPFTGSMILIRRLLKAMVKNTTAKSNLDVILARRQRQSDQTDAINRHDLVTDVQSTGACCWTGRHQISEHHCRQHAAPAGLHQDNAERLAFQFRYRHLQRRHADDYTEATKHKSPNHCLFLDLEFKNFLNSLRLSLNTDSTCS